MPINISKRYFIMSFYFLAFYFSFFAGSVLFAQTAADAPTALAASPGVSSANISFTEPASNGGLPIINYEFQLDGGAWTAFSPAVTSTSVSISGLTNCNTYSVELRAITAFGAGAVSSSVQVTPQAGEREGINWTARTAAEANQWTSVTYGNGLYVAVSFGGTNRVMTSPDGITWTARAAAELNFWISVTYGNGLFVAVAISGTNRVMTSPDGITWTARAATEDNVWRSVTYGNGLFVAVAVNGNNRVMTSPDGITWTARAAAEPNSWWSVTYGNGLFVAVAVSGTNQVMTSPDGITWTARAAAAANLWYSVTYGNGLFVAVAENGTNRVMNSSALFAPDAPSITGITASTTSLSVAFTPPASPGGSAISNYDYSIDDGSNWVTVNPAQTTSPLVISGLTQVTTYPIKLRAVNAQGASCESGKVDGTTLTPVAADPPTALAVSPGVSSANISFTEPASNGGLPIINYEFQLDGGAWTAFSPAVTSTSVSIPGLTNCTTYSVELRAITAFGPGAVSSSVQVTPQAGDGEQAGITWTARAVPEPNGSRSVTYGNGLFVAISNFGTNQVMTSPDGITWTGRAAAEASSWRSVTYGNGLFVAVAVSGTNRVMTSPDGITWTGRAAAEANQWWSVTYGNGLFVAVAGSGTNRVMTSPDGITWTARAAAEANYWHSVTYGNGLFVAVAITGTNRVMTSPDGIAWTATAAAAANPWYSVTYGNGLFVAVAGDGTDRVMTSPDGIIWTARSAAEDNFWYSVTYGNGQFVAVALDGTNRVMSSSAIFVPGAPSITGITASATSLSVAFSAPANPGGSAISNYDYSIDGGANWVSFSPAQSTSPLVIEGLNTELIYPIRIRAVNEQGASCESNTVEYCTLTMCPTCAPETQLNSLIALYEAFDGDSWQWSDPSKSWKDSQGRFRTLDFAGNNWEGVTLDAQCNIIALDLSQKAPSGNLPENIGDLTALTSLKLAGTNIRGRIPAGIKNLNLTELTISYNAVFTDDESVKEFIDRFDPGWDLTQTVAPINVRANLLNPSAIISWTPIVYQGGTGRYFIKYRAEDAGGFTTITVEGKDSSEGLIPTLEYGKRYLVYVQSQTDANPPFNPSPVTSEGSEVIKLFFATTIPATERAALIAL